MILPKVFTGLKCFFFKSSIQCSSSLGTSNIKYSSSNNSVDSTCLLIQLATPVQFFSQEYQSAFESEAW